MSAAVATSDPRATQAAEEVFRRGGNAVDAAVTAALVLYVVEPQSCGIGGDAFMFVHTGAGPPTALDGSGAVPVNLTPDALARAGLDQVPSRGAKTATPPGAVPLLETALRDFGTISLSRAIAPALELARSGFAVRRSMADAADRAADEAKNDPVLGPLYWPSGRALQVGEFVANSQLADALERIATLGAQELLTGSLGESIVETINDGGGFLTLEDMAAHQTQVVTPSSVDFAGHTMWQMPSPTQGPAVLAALRDIDETALDWAEIYRQMHSAMREAGFDPAAVGSAKPSPAKGDTTFIAAVGHDGMGVSLITSVFGDFGSHLGVPALGGPIHNRATTFRIAAQPLVAGKKPPHTTIPGLITTTSGRLRYVLGVAGGVMQPQTQVQLALRTLVEGIAPQAAIDMPRFKICFGGALAVERGHPLGATFPDALEKNPGPEGFGAAQMIGWHEGSLRAGADRRRGGKATVLPDL